MKTISLVAAMFLTVVLSGPAADAGRVPFNGTIVASESYQLFGNPPLGFFVNAEGTASATQLGQLTVLYTAIVDFATGDAPEAARFIDANGDSIFTCAMGASSDTADPDVKAIVERNTITGGTGRYANAKGNFTVNRLVNIVTGATTGSFHGTIKLKKH